VFAALTIKTPHQREQQKRQKIKNRFCGTQEQKLIQRKHDEGDKSFENKLEYNKCGIGKPVIRH
jgi:hypothetical protein